MMKLTVLSYHPNRCNGFGGIENLVRSIKLSVEQSNIEIYELYNREPPVEEIEIACSEFDIQKKLFFESGFLAVLNKAFVFYQQAIRSQYDVVITYHPANLLFFLLTKHKPKIILVQSNSVEKLFQGRILKALSQKILNRVDALTLYTSFDKQALCRRFQVDDNKISIIPRACKLPTTAPRESKNYKLVTICRIVENQKNFTAMIQIMAKIPEMTLDIYGTGSVEEVKSLKNKISKSANIRFFGKTNDVAKTLSEYSIFIMTSYYEGYGQSLIEARSQGLPIVLFNTFDAAQSVVIDGKNGFLIAPFDQQLFIDGIRKILTIDSVYQHMSFESISLSATSDTLSIQNKWLRLFKSLQQA
ncbi:glycosyltransferase [Paraglaciecola sp. MB-3u-78]|uniref:glycosyltransferase n=1 Tax=Paraglaciecola sp. MB-3u-78 TaxID=2058332 RepID=UPI000C324EFD|nr:glycosyltransferase [Paraglaciecola sp. MB-3u-78]PKG98778.1 glycosyl transferase family 1 [Paraglaciecola sp. MB-3u-78]